MPFAEKLYDVGEKLELNRKCSVSHVSHISSDCYGTYQEVLSSNYASGFDVSFYIGLTTYNNIDEPGKNQWRWSSTGRMISKDTLGERGDCEGNYYGKDTWKLISFSMQCNYLDAIKLNESLIE